MNFSNALEAFFSANRDAIVRDLRRMVAIPSVLAEAAPGAPFGIECARCLNEAAAMYRENGFDAKVYEDSGYALVEFGEGEKTIGIYAHSDVVPVVPSDWIKTTPFDLKEEGDFVFGRGVGDNKSAVVGSLWLFKAIRELNLPLNHKILLFVGSNEEAGMADIANFAAEQPMPQLSLVPDGGFPVCLGECGIVRADIHGQKKMHDILDIQGGEAYNIIMPSLKCTVRASEAMLNWLKENPQEWLDVEHKGTSIVLNVAGIAAHAAAPQNGISALKRLADLFAGCDVLDVEDRTQFEIISKALSDTKGEAMGFEDTDPILGALTCGNGIVRCEDGKICFTFDIRHGSTISGKSIMRAIDTFFGDNFKSDVHSDSEAFSIPVDDPAALAILQAYREASGDQESSYFYMGGGTYCKYLKNAFSTGICCDAHEAFEALGLPEGHGHAHQADECMNIPAYLTGISVFGNILLNVDKII